MLLAIDTSAGTSVAIVDRGTVHAERSSADSRRHAELIDELIGDCLTAARMPVTAIDAVAVGMGPGPFTGLRVGIAAGRAFAFGSGTPVLAVRSHDAIAFGLAAAGELQPTLVVTDARRKEVYWSSYSGLDPDGVPLPVAGPSLARPEDLPGAVAGFARYRRVDAPGVSAASVGLLAEVLKRHGRELAGPRPLYLRSADVTLSSGPKRVTQ